MGQMARGIHRLTEKAVQRAKKKGYLSDGGGLYLRVGPTGAKSWVFRFRKMVDGKTKLTEMGLGPLHTVTIAEARDKAMKRCKEVQAYREGEVALDPLAAKRAVLAARGVASAKAMTFRACAEAYIDAQRAGWRGPANEIQWRQSLTDYAYPVFGALPVQAVDVPLVMKVVEPIWTTKPETASRVRGRIESVLNWATTRGFRAGENPARWRGHLENLLPSRAKVRRVKHLAALPYAKVGGFVAALRREHGVASRALEFIILTACRTGEVLGARWEEIDLGEGVWVIPAARMKAGREHRVPLSGAALAVLARMQPSVGLVFPGLRPGKPMGRVEPRRVLDRMGVGVTVHGFRSTFAQWAAERTAYPHEVREMALAHAVGDAVVRAYQRSDLFDRRRRLMDDWARWCAGQAGGEVVPIRA